VVTLLARIFHVSDSSLVRQKGFWLLYFYVLYRNFNQEHAVALWLRDYCTVSRKVAGLRSDETR
jgi:hypothetical protein